jgi:hypothetical protein
MGATPLPRLVGAAIVLAAVLAWPAPGHAIDQRKPAGQARTWYVDNTAAPEGDGSMVAPFDRLARAERAADAGDTIYVFRGDGTARGLDAGIRLRPHQRLVGSGAPLLIEGEASLPAGERPLLSAASGPAVVLADHVRVEGLAIGGADGVAIDGDGIGDAWLAGLRVDGALRLRDPRGVVRVESTDLRARGTAALAVASTHGEGRVELDGVTLAGAGGSDDGLSLRAGGDGVLTVAVASTVLEGIAGNGFALAADGHGRLRLEVAGSGLVGELPGGTAAALAAVAREDGIVEVTARGNDLPAREAAVLLSATGRGRLRVELLANVVGGPGAARGVVLLLGDAGEAALTLDGNRITGQRGEAVYAVTGGQSSLGIAARDNDLASGAALGNGPFPALLVEGRDTGRACLTLADNRFAGGASPAPSAVLRQRDASALAVGGYSPAAAGDLTQRLAANNRIGRAEVESDRPLADPAGSSCLPLPPPQPAVAAATASPAT